MTSIRCAAPGVVESYDAETGTASVRPAVSRRLRGGGSVAPPLLESVPVLLPAADAEIVPGMTCLLIFCDDCIDGFLRPDLPSVPVENRHHDWSDAFAIPNMRSVTR